MADLHDIIVFSLEGEKILGVVIEHYTNPLDDFYLVYADYAIHKLHNPNEDAETVVENVIIPSCDEAIADYRLKRQHFSDLSKLHREIEELIGIMRSKIDMESIFDDDKL